MEELVGELEERNKECVELRGQVAAYRELIENIRKQAEEEMADRNAGLSLYTLCWAQPLYSIELNSYSRFISDKAVHPLAHHIFPTSFSFSVISVPTPQSLVCDLMQLALP